MSQPYGILLFVLIEAARRVEAAAKEMLTLVNAGAASCAELREMLAAARRAAAMISAAQTSAAATVSGRERHGDRGAQVLADSAGLTRQEAHSQIKTAATIQASPAVREAVESGRVPQANARRLAEAISKTDAQTVEADPGLLAKAESLRPDQFTREARRWTADRQGDGGEADYQRMRARRSVRIYDGDDGMVHLHGEFDPVTGKRIANRLHHHARKLHSADQHTAAKGDRRRFPQCLADALDNLTATGHGDTGRFGTSGDNTGSADAATRHPEASGDSADSADAATRRPEASGDNTGSADAATRGSGRPFADICVVAHVDDDTGRLIGELPDGSRLPEAVLDELGCNATITGVIFDRSGKPVWQTTAGRDATATQRRILKAKWGGCFHCGANFAICQPHHINPVSRGGQTHVENLVPACWECHQLIHHDGWQIHKSPDGNHTLHPPERIHYGPAHMPEQPPPIIAAPQLFTPTCEPEPPPDTLALFTQPPGPDPRTTAADAIKTARAGPDPGLPPAHPPPSSVGDNVGTIRRGPRREPTPAGQPPSPRTGPARARAVLQASRATRTAHAGPN